LSLGSGPYVALAIALASGLKLLRPATRNGWTWVTLAICALIVLANIPFVVRGPTGNSSYKAKSIQSFVTALLRQASWPSIDYHLMWLALLVFLPIAWLIFTVLRSRRDLPASVYAVIGLGTWNALLIISLAFARASLVPYVRYYDYYAFNLIACALALIEIVRLRLYPNFFAPAVLVLPSFLVAAFIFGAFDLLFTTLNYWLPNRVHELQAQQQAIKTYFQSGNVDALKGSDLHGTYPFNETWYRSLGSTLVKPEVKAVLPVQLRPEFDGQKPIEGSLTKLRQALLRHIDRKVAGVILFTILFVGTWIVLLLPLRSIARETMVWRGPADQK
jgi:hypothetical protein